MIQHSMLKLKRFDIKSLPIAVHHLYKIYHTESLQMATSFKCGVSAAYKWKTPGLNLFSPHTKTHTHTDTLTFFSEHEVGLSQAGKV